MFDVLRIVHLASPDAAPEVERELRHASAALGAARVTLAPTLPGGWNGGDLLWRVAFASEAAARNMLGSDAWRRHGEPLFADRARVARYEHAAFAPIAHGGASPLRGVYRVALFCANRRPTAARLARFAAETAAMPRQVRSIRAYQLSTTADARGSMPWTHVWEQEYDDLTGLLGPYMLHPCHWSQVDRWFDPEDPDWLVDPALCHTFCETRAPVLA